MDDLFFSSQFPLSSKYHPEWIKAGVSGGANPLWLTEWLTKNIDIKPGMRILDLGCGKGMSSIFLHKEFGAQVWAVDLAIPVSDIFTRIKDAGVDDAVFPLNVDARHLPFPPEFFDVIVSIDSFFYYGTDDLYLNSILHFLKPDGIIGIAGAGLMEEITGSIPPNLSKWWTPDLWCLHSAEWWQRHWEKTGLAKVAIADTMPEGWKFWLQWHHAIAPDNALEIEALNQDAGDYLGYVRCIAQKREGITLQEHPNSMPVEYIKTPLLRNPSMLPT